MRRWLAFLIAVLVARSVCPEVYDEYAVKAAYLYNFAKFVEWPSGTFSNHDAPLVICIAGDNPFGDTLAAISNKNVDSHPVEVRIISLTARLDQCHVVFIGRADQEQFKTVLLKLARLPVLTVSDINGFAQAGGMIELFKTEQRIRFNISIQATHRANLKLSSQLLKLATIVD
ncbi:MAG: YfiR family protein [Candidatus Competibacter sp.]|nr:YfiR family protein [Candidatus Competibacter sp.]MDG4584307.1 YfiR family protein [Candidatus Competibacter sp.]